MALLDEGTFRAEVVEDISADGHGPRQIVRVVGEIDMATAPTFEAALGMAFAERCTVIVDMAAVTFMGSSGIGELVRARKRLHAVDGELMVTNATENIRRTFTICGLDHLFCYS
jgi:anti-sigma B factor antagonist